MAIRTEGLNFTNQQTFSGVGGPITDASNNVDTFPTGLTLAQMEGHKLMYDALSGAAGGTSSAASFNFRGALYTMDIDENYNGKTFAVMAPDRFAATFVFDKSTEEQGGAATLSGTFVMGPEERRLYHLGYI